MVHWNYPRLFWIIEISMLQTSIFLQFKYKCLMNVQGKKNVTSENISPHCESCFCVPIASRHGHMRSH